MKTMQSTRNDNDITKEEFIEAAQKIRESETKPIKIIGDDGAPTIREVISNQKRLATMLEYLVQKSEQDM
jgi:hypothetical protein